MTENHKIIQYLVNYPCSESRKPLDLIKIKTFLLHISTFKTFNFKITTKNSHFSAKNGWNGWKSRKIHYFVNYSSSKVLKSLYLIRIEAFRLYISISITFNFKITTKYSHFKLKTGWNGWKSVNFQYLANDSSSEPCNPLKSIIFDIFLRCV